MLGGAPAWPSSGPITAWPGDDMNPRGMNVLLMEPQGRARVDAVGESHYQGTLEAIAGGRTTDGVRNPDHLAALIPEPTNPYDPKAVREVIVPTKGGQAWGHVGHLSREDAVAYRPVIDAAAAVAHVIGCRASLTGGWDRGHGDRGSIGVILALRTPAECAAEAAARGVAMPAEVLSPAPVGIAPGGVDDRPYNRDDCPYCHATQDPLPKAKRKCLNCAQPIYVRAGADGLRHLLREADLEAFQTEWDQEMARRYDQGGNRYR